MLNFFFVCFGRVTLKIWFFFLKKVNEAVDRRTVIDLLVDVGISFENWEIFLIQHKKGLSKIFEYCLIKLSPNDKCESMSSVVLASCFFVTFIFFLLISYKRRDQDLFWLSSLMIYTLSHVFCIFFF